MKRKNIRTLAQRPLSCPRATGVSQVPEAALREQRRLCAPRGKSGALAPGAAAPARFPRQPHAARRVSRVTRRQRRPGTRIPEPEPRWSAADQVRRGATRRSSSLRGHSEGMQQAPLPSPGLWSHTAAWTPLGIHFRLSRWRGCQYHGANKRQSLPAGTAQPGGST